MHLSLRGRMVASDHGWLLWQALREHAPWLEDEPLAGIHAIQGADDGAGALILGHRAKLVVRCPVRRVDQLLSALSGKTLMLGEHSLVVGAGKSRALSTYSPLYAHCVVTGDEDEAKFAREVLRLLRDMDIECRFICGRPQLLYDGTQQVRGYSLLLHNLPLAQAIAVQQHGIGLHRKLGCGLFIPHKSIVAVGSVESV